MRECVKRHLSHVDRLLKMSIFSHINKVVEASGKKSLLGLIFSFDGLKIFADGNIGCDMSFAGGFLANECPS